MRANGSTSFVTTAPAPIKQYSPKVMPQIIVELAPSVAPFFTRVGRNSFFFSIMDRGFKTFVKTVLGPQKTSSSIVTESKILTLFCTLQLLPINTF